MSTDKVGAAGTDGAGKKVVAWESFIPKVVDFEDCVSAVENQKVWERIYQKAGKGTASEDQRRAVRAAVYLYCLFNGTSREGDYSGSFVLSDGTSVSASVIPAAASKMKIRKFLRANMAESYQFFKTSRVAETDARFVAKCSALSIAPEVAFATADWMADCPDFTPAESRAHEAAFTRSIDRAKRARQGKTLEEVESSRLDASMAVQGPARETGNIVDF